MPLAEYRRKRDFRRTTEPAPRAGPRRARGAKRDAKREPSFVIQKHAATSLHYDLRLEVGGVFKSWAVPKGMPMSRGSKRLAIMVEDHPLEYGKFEGVIPKGEYGAGAVIIWDRGTYAPEQPAARALDDGKLTFALHGRKLRGDWALVRMNRDNGNQWLVLKTGESLPEQSKSADDTSVASGRTLAEVGGRSRVAATQKPRAGGAARAIAKSGAAANPARSAASRSVSGGVGEFPRFIEAMLARLVGDAPEGGEWSYEVKFDGYRALAMAMGGSSRLYSRNAIDWTQRFPEIAEAVARLPGDELVLDGEIVALDAGGRPSFRLLQGMGSKPPPIVYYVFDLLRHDGTSLLALPLADRRKRLQKVMARARDPLRYSASLEGSAGDVLAQVGKLGLEGIVAKKLASRYEPGRRSGAWVKLKHLKSQEFVIGGYTKPQGSREHLGAVLVGYYDRKKLRFAGKVGTGFDHAACRDVHGRLHKIERPTPPFTDAPRAMRGCHWTEPRLVCHVEFTEWTGDGKLRHPVFLGLRDDKSPSDVHREREGRERER